MRIRKSEIPESIISSLGFDGLTGTTTLRNYKAYVFTVEGDRHVIPREWFGGSGRKGLDELHRRGLLVPGLDTGKSILANLASISLFPPEPYLDHAGWNGAYFNLWNTTVISPDDAPTGFSVTARPHSTKGVAGDHETWMKELFPLVHGQPALEFSLATAFAATLLSSTTMIRNPVVVCSGCMGPTPR